MRFLLGLTLFLGIDEEVRSTRSGGIMMVGD
jgi:hypothetical protein